MFRVDVYVAGLKNEELRLRGNYLSSAEALVNTSNATLHRAHGGPDPRAGRYDVINRM